jgi:hypothetical protein
MRLAFFVSAALIVGACHYQPTPVPLSGERSSIRALRGNWTGTYRGTESGRTGSITFTIRTDADSAFGEVYMDAPQGVQAADDPRIHQRHVSNPRYLAIRFVDVIGGEVEGALEPYVAPDCDCTVTTRFTGRVIADTIRGTYITRGPMIVPQTGVWAIMRDK